MAQATRKKYKQVEVSDELRDHQRYLRDAYTGARYQYLRDLQRKLLGFDDHSQADSIGSDGTVVYYEPLIRSADEYHKANRILNNIRLLMSQTRAVEIMPEWTGVPNEYQEQARNAYFTQRSQGTSGYGGWKDDYDRALMDFAALGIGFLRIAIDENGGYNYVCPKYRSPLHVGYDPYALHPSDSVWFWDLDVWSLEDAQERFPDFDFTGQDEQLLSADGISAKGVRIIEYFNRKPRKGLPGYMAILKDLDGEVIEIADNPYGDMCPYGVYQAFVPPGSKYPVGLVEMQSYAADIIEQIDDLLHEYAERGTQIAADPQLLDADVWEKLKNGEKPRYVPLSEKYALAEGRAPFIQIPRDTAPSELMVLRQTWEQFLRESSGVSSAMAGVISPESRTATEINQVASQSSAQTSFLSREFARSCQQFYPKLAMAAMLYDSATWDTVYGAEVVTFNTGDDPYLSAEFVFSGSKSCVVSEQALMNTDVNARREREAIMWDAIWQRTQSPAAMKKFIEVQGIKNPEEYMPQAPQGAPGMMSNLAGQVPAM